MKKLALLFIAMTISFVGFTQQKAQPLENVDNELFQIEKHFLLDLDGVPDYGFMVIGLEDYDMGVSLYSNGDSIVHRIYSEPILSWLIEYNKARDNGEEPQPPVLNAEYKLKIENPADFSAIAQFLQNIVDTAKPFKEIPCVDGVNWVIFAKGKWAYIHTGGFHKEGAITDILELIAIGCESNDPSMLTREAICLE
ncbi:hypothetical protein [Muribaculum sp.]|uniref:hypothetical protein n=1 Tax=Muribaculum sp. TaxID=1918611 RepID=UPI00257BED3E|nr:hypothetical protein [Muribaculum sp.]MCX4279227.1 hypothetical protein [Muribaculum sp.]